MSGICPILSTDFLAKAPVYCLTGGCAIWNDKVNRCGFIQDVKASPYFTAKIKCSNKDCEYFETCFKTFDKCQAHWQFSGEVRYI